MPVYLFNQVIPTVDRDTVVYNASLNVSGTPGGGGKSTFSFNCTLDSNSAVKPRSGNIVTWVRDDGTNIKQFSGPIVTMQFKQVGFNEAGLNVYSYNMQCRDLSYFLEQQYLEGGKYNQKKAQTVSVITGERVINNPLTAFTEVSVSTIVNFPSYLGKSYKELIEIIAQFGDPRIKLDPLNQDALAMLPQDYQFSRITVRALMDQLSIEANLIWWIDANYVLHIRSLDQIISLPVDDTFTIKESSLNYYRLDLTEDFNNLKSRVRVSGNFHDAGFLVEKNRVDGVQRTEELAVTVTNRKAIDEIILRCFPKTGSRIAQLGGSAQTLFYPPKVVSGVVVFDEGPFDIDPALEVTLIPQSHEIGAKAELLREGSPGVLDAAISAPNAYFDDTNQADEFLVSVGQQWLAYHSRPSLMGSVYYNSGIPQLGHPVKIHLDQLGISQISAVASITISSNGNNQGNNESGHRIYTYKMDFQDYGYHLRFSRQFYNYQYIQKRPDRSLKPGPPEIVNAYFDVNNSIYMMNFTLKMATRNPDKDWFDQDQPTIPPVVPSMVEARFATNTLALSNPDSTEIYWQKFTGILEPNIVHLANLGPFNQFVNDYISEIQKWRCVGVINSDTVFFQVRVATGVSTTSDWTPVKQITVGESKDGNDHTAPKPPGSSEGISGNPCPPPCTPPSPPPPPPSCESSPSVTIYRLAGLLRGTIPDCAAALPDIPFGSAYSTHGSKFFWGTLGGDTEFSPSITWSGSFADPKSDVSSVPLDFTVGDLSCCYFVNSSKWGDTSFADDPCGLMSSGVTVYKYHWNDTTVDIFYSETVTATRTSC